MFFIRRAVKITLQPINLEIALYGQWASNPLQAIQSASASLYHQIGKNLTTYPTLISYCGAKKCLKTGPTSWAGNVSWIVLKISVME